MGSPGGHLSADGDKSPPCPRSYPGKCAFDSGRKTVNRIGPQTTFDETLHFVTLSHSFYMMTHEVTMAYFKKVSGFHRIGWSEESEGDEDSGGPVDNLTWYDAVYFANLASDVEGLPRCYKLENITCLKQGDTTLESQSRASCFKQQLHIASAKVTINSRDGSPYSCSGYRLPTEAEWEYAARAGTQTPYYNGVPSGKLLEEGSDATLDEVAWYDTDRKDSKYPVNGAQPVGLKRPNDFGLYDMLGNVWEYVFDTYGEYLPKDSAETSTSENPLIDPYYFAPTGDKVNRGGGWASHWAYCRAAQRNSFDGSKLPEVRARGIRLVRTLR
jgi:formylglycine-generating enzyme required for sulfatase activity